MKAYKGFNPDMTCRGFQYKEGETYKEDNASLCNSGFHACENPLEVFTYYPPCDENGNLNKFHEVEMEDVSPERDSDSTKICSKQIKIGAELNFFGLAKAHIEWVKTQLDDSSSAVNSGDRSSAVNSGKDSIAVAWGIDSKAKATLGSYIVLAEWIYNEDDCAYVLKGAKMRKVDGVNIKEDTYYQLKNGRFVEVKE